MPSSKFKVCPVCSEHNPSARLECKKCETDLTGVKVVDEEILTSQNKAVKEDAAAGKNRDLVKVCDCGVENPPQARKCSACGEDIFDVRATEPQTSIGTIMTAVLRSVDGSFSLAIEKPITIIGRESELSEQLKTKAYVSRKHAKLTYIDSEIYIENLSSTNHTFVNNTLIPCDYPTLLKNGDEVGLGGKVINGERQGQAAYFVIEVSA